MPYYGTPFGDSAPDWSGLTASVYGHFAADDSYFSAEAVRALEAELKGLGKDVRFEIHPSCGHAFTNPANVFGTYDPELTAKTWATSVAFLHEKLG